MTLTFKLSLDMLRPDLHAKIHLCVCARSARIVRRADGHTDRQTHDVKTITPSADVGCKKVLVFGQLNLIACLEAKCFSSLYAQGQKLLHNPWKTKHNAHSVKVVLGGSHG